MLAALGEWPTHGAVVLGVIVSVGVLIDTLVIRKLLVTALSVDAGRRFWWPGRLAATHVGRHEATPELPGSRP